MGEETMGQNLVTVCLPLRRSQRARSQTGCWKLCWVSGRLAQFAKWFLNRAAVSVKKELRHLQIYWVQLKRLPWGGLQWAAVFLLNSLLAKEVA